MTEFRPGRKIYKVSELAGKINQSLTTDFGDIWVQGEISNFSKHKSGHYFFALKDKDAKLSAIMFRFQAIYTKFTPQDGLEVTVRGRLNYYEPRGELRMIVEFMEPVGIGALQLALEQMRATLEKEGLFAQERKRAIPAFCRRIAIITSPTGAVFHDMLKVFRQNRTRVQILLLPSRVQGEGSEFELAKALELANRPEIVNPLNRPSLDAIILARGGGSLEDLWAFNTEHLARAIARSKVPVISAIGHEVDYTISDLVSDLRALTPTAAAEFIARSQRDMLQRLDAARSGLERAMIDEVKFKAETIKKFLRLGQRVRVELDSLGKDIAYKRLHLNSSLAGQLREKRDQMQSLGRSILRLSPMNWLQRNKERLYRLEMHLNQAMRTSINENRELLLNSSARLYILSPLSTLARGYAIARSADTRRVVKSQSEVEKGDSLQIILHQGELGVKVEKKLERNPWEDMENRKKNEK